MVPTLEALYSNPKQLEVVLSYHVGVRHSCLVLPVSMHLLNEEGYMEVLEVLGTKDPTQYSNMFEKQDLWSARHVPVHVMAFTPARGSLRTANRLDVLSDHRAGVKAVTVHGHLGWCGGLQSSQSWVLNVSIPMKGTIVLFRYEIAYASLIPRTDKKVLRGAPHAPAREKRLVWCTTQSPHASATRQYHCFSKFYEIGWDV